MTRFLSAAEGVALALTVALLVIAATAALEARRAWKATTR